ncbi:MAG: hypothetical protein HKN70_11040 [Gammaproteobacteria bacterium]|nr:hypothetical protein [Gammaproteobacteria bacterium]
MSRPEKGGFARPARRRILIGLGTGALATAAFDSAPVWVKPAVKSVVLPAHATTSGTAIVAQSLPDPPGFEVVIDADFACGASVPFGGRVMAGITVIPPPPAGSVLTIAIECGARNTTLAQPLDVAGTATITLEAAAFCDPIPDAMEPNPPNTALLTLSATYDVEEASCFWTFEGRVIPLMTV